VPPVPPIPGSSKSPMQARGAKSATPGSDELIEFIRSGPEEDGKHRISRTIAPFRSTMDSDQLKELAGILKERQDPDVMDVNFDSAAAPSVPNTSSRPASRRTSIASRSALLHRSSNINKSSATLNQGFNQSSSNLNASSTNLNASSPNVNRNSTNLNGSSTNLNQMVRPTSSGQTQKLSQSRPSSSSGAKKNLTQENAPVKKRYRSKDPYALDFLDDDEDEDHLTSLPKASRQDESMADFLNSNEPPQDNAPKPVVRPNSSKARSAVAGTATSGTLTPGTATPNTETRRGVTLSDPSNPSRPKSGGTFPERPRSIAKTAGPRSGQTAPRARSSNRPAASDSVPPAIPSSRRQTMTGTAPTSGTSTPKMQARGSAKDVKPNSSTKDLANFFRDEEPDGADSAPAPIIGRKTREEAQKEEEMAKNKAEKKSRGGFFSRTKKKDHIEV
ncbi:Transmembrane emp24 domain-containing protein 10, partial [Vermiconidia calcicola]